MFLKLLQSSYQKNKIKKLKIVIISIRNNLNFINQNNLLHNRFLDLKID